MLTSEPDAKQTFRKHRQSVRTQSTKHKRLSFHASVLTSSQHMQKIDELAENIPAYRRWHVLVVPFESKHKIWLGFQLCFTMMTMICNPWLVGFGLSSSEDLLHSYDTAAVSTLLYVLDVFAFIDMISICFTGYHDQEQARIILRTYQATYHYLLSWKFLFDFISIFPIEMFTSSPWEINSLTFRVLLLRRMFRFWRASGTWKFVDHLQHTVASNSSLFPIFKLIGTIVYVSHFFACMLQLVRWSEGTFNLPQQLSEFSHPNDSSLYTRSIYETIYLLLGESMSDVYTKNERIFVYLCVLLGAVLNAWLFGQVAIYVDSMMRDSLGYQALMHDVHAHMTSLNLPSDVRIRVLSYFDFLWSRNKSGSNRNEFMSKISPSLRAEISLFQHRELISRVDFFRGAPVGFIVEVAMRLDSKLFLPGDYVIREDDFGTEMFFVVSGSCQCLVKKKVVRLFRANDMFGEIALLKTEPVRRTATIKSELYSELVVLQKTDFLDCLAIHPDAAKGVYGVMREKIDGYTGANRKKLNRSASVMVREKVEKTKDDATTDDVATKDTDPIARPRKRRQSSFIRGAGRVSTTPTAAAHGASPLSSESTTDIESSSPMSTKYDGSLTAQQFLENRSGQFGIEENLLKEFVKEYTMKLYTKQRFQDDDE